MLCLCAFCVALCVVLCFVVCDVFWIVSCRVFSVVVFGDQFYDTCTILYYRLCGLFVKHFAM